MVDFIITLKKNLKKVELKIRYKVPKIAYASHLKSDVQALFAGRFLFKGISYTRQFN